MSSNPIIESITCPINGTVMVDPVQGNDGQTYERSAIVKWLTEHKQESPITKEPMTINDIKVNASIRFLCDKYHAGELTIDDASNSTNNTDHKFKITSATNHPKILNTKFKKLSDKNSTSTLMIKLLVDDINDNDNDTDNVNENENYTLSHDVIVVIDRSGSMSLSVEAKDENGNSLEDGLSQQDIVNHSAKMIAKTLALNSNNRLAIIAFDNSVDTVFNFMLMTEMNCCRAISQIDIIKPRGQTAIWQGIETAINMLSSRDDKSRNPHIMLLTDGIPNISPARGEVNTLEKKMKESGLYIPIYTFGFGYNLKKGLLYDIAKSSGGSVGHIPDGGMIATVFSNFISNIMCTIAYNLKLTVEFDDKNVNLLPHIHGDFKYDIHKRVNNTIEKIIIHIGTIQIGQSRDIIISDSNILKYTYNYQIADTDYQVVEIVDPNTHTMDNLCFGSNITRLFLVEKIRLAIALKLRDQSAVSIYTQIIEHFNDIDTISDYTWGTLMLETITDQVRLALSDDPNHSTYFNRWGIWYLDQLSSALSRQLKPNFKDTACCFGGQLFNKIVDYSSDQFDSLPPPTPSNNSALKASSYQNLGVTNSLQPIRMATYNSQNNPCFDGNCLVTMANGFQKKVCELQKDDLISTLSDPFDSLGTKTIGKVVCILKTVILGGICHMVTFPNGLKITPWHPVLQDKHTDSMFQIDIDKWMFPNNIYLSKICEQTAVYSILLDNHHICCINNIWCICLGHNYTCGILKHEYFGSQKIVENMRIMKGWNNGLIKITSDDIVRDTLTGLVCEINQDPNI
mgnify:CR=1 FL=1